MVTGAYIILFRNDSRGHAASSFGGPVLSATLHHILMSGLIAMLSNFHRRSMAARSDRGSRTAAALGRAGRMSAFLAWRRLARGGEFSYAPPCTLPS
jgi:hypothetical protein